MTEVQAISRGKFIRNAAKGGIVLATTGGVLASMDGIAFASTTTKSDITTLQTAFIAETLAVKVYSAVIANFSSFKGLKNKDYFVAALANEKDHLAYLGSALGSMKPTGFTVSIPKAVVASTKALTSTGVALESAFVSTYLGAVDTLSSTDLKLVAAKVAADEASHFSFFDAANGGHGVLPSLPTTVTAAQAAALLKKDGFLS